MDLFEYQARNCSPSTASRCCPARWPTPPRRREAIAERIGGAVVVKAQVKTGGRGKAGGVKLATTPTRPRRRASDILGMDIKGHTVHRVLVDPGADIDEEYYFSFLLDRANRTFLAMASVEGGMEIEQLAVERPDALARVPVDAIAGVDAGQGRRDRRRGRLPGRGPTRSIATLSSSCGQVSSPRTPPWSRSTRWCRYAADGDGRRAGRQGHPRRQRRLPAPRARRRWSTRAAADPLEAQGQGEGPQLRQARRRGRHHRQRRRAGDVHPGRGRLRRGGRHGGVRPANFLDIGGGASAEVMANGLEIILGDPAVGRCSSTSSAASPPATRSPTASCRRSRCWHARARRSTKPLVVRLDGNNAEEGRRILTEAAHPLVSRWTRWTAPPSGSPSSRDARTREALTWRSSSTADSKVIVQGMTGSEGTQAHPPDGRLRHQIVGGVNPRKGGEEVDVDGADVPVFGTVGRRDQGDRRRRLGRVRPAAVRQGRRHRGDRRRRCRWCVVITEGIPVHDTAAFFRLRRERRHDPARSARTAPA